MKQIVFILALLLPICGFAQFSDDFSNSDLNQNWKGNISKFSVKYGQLWLDAEPGKAGIASIYHEYTAFPTMEWTFDVLLDVNPSSQNKVVIYPCYNPENDDYIYLNVGASKNADLDLFHKGGISILDNKPRELPYSDFPCVVHIKLTLENGEKWTLYSSLDGMEYTKEGEGIYDVANPDNNVLFHIQMEYTKTRYNSFGIDNVRISDTISDTPLEPEDSEEDNVEKPVLEEIYFITSSRLLFEFNKEIDYSNAIVTMSEIGPATRFNYNQEAIDNSEVIVSFASDFEMNKEYELHIEGFKDLDGNIVPVSDEILCFLDEEDEGSEEDDETTTDETEDNIPYDAVYISEIMADPKGSVMPETEYVELYNSYDRTVSLKNWNLVYRNEVYTDLSNVVIPSESYVILYREGDEMKEELLNCSFALQDFPVNLANTGHNIQLLNSSGTVVDNVDYPKATPGVSWEKGEKGWALSTDKNGGTPGTRNSSPSPEEEEEEPEDGDKDEENNEPSPILISEGDIIINELLPNPLTGGSEYVELYNRSGKSLPISGLALSTRKSDGEFRTVYRLNSLDITLGSDEYIVLTSDAEGVTDNYYTPDENLIHEIKMPVLSNDGATLVLYNASDSSVVDEVLYDDKWHSAMVKDEKGVSLERINPDGPSSDSENWTSAAEDSGYGTPGYLNSQYLKEKDDDGPLGIEKPVYSPADGLYTISYELDKAGYMANVYIYDISGRLLDSPFVKYSVGTSGVLQWNGFVGGRKPDSGVYVMFVEIYHPEGDVHRKKCAFLIR